MQNQLQAVDAGFTSAYSIGLATALNPTTPSKPYRAAAELWHYLCWKYNDVCNDNRVQARDGYFYVKYDVWGFHTGYTARTFTDCCKILKDAGLIDCKKMYILGTHTSVNHFKLLYPSWELCPDSAFFHKPDWNSLPVSGLEVTSSPYNKEENKEDYCKVSQSTTDSTLGSPDLRSGHQSIQTSEIGETSVASCEIDGPFDNTPAPAPISVRPDKTAKANPNAHAFAILGDIYKTYGLKGRPTVGEAGCVNRALKGGWKDKEIKAEVAWARADKFWADKPLQTQLKAEAFKQYEAKMNANPSPSSDNTRVNTYALWAEQPEVANKIDDYSRKRELYQNDPEKMAELNLEYKDFIEEWLAQKKKWEEMKGAQDE